jgi:hypothetical protein
LKIVKPNRAGLLQIRTTLVNRPWSILSWTSGIAAAAFILYYGLQVPLGAKIDLGAQFVLTEWPGPQLFPFFYAKPITWFSYFAFLYWAFGLESQKPHLLRLSPRTRRALFIVTSVVAFGALYEIFFNFALWSAFMDVSGVLSSTCNASPPACSPDALANKFPSTLTNPINLVFATKVVTTVFALSIYSLWFLNRLEKETEARNVSPWTQERT